MDGFLNTHFRDWKLGATCAIHDGIRYHRDDRGAIIESWRPVKRLGVGTFGHVWKEKGVGGPTLDQVRVVKKLRKERVNFIQSSRRELYALTTFSKKGVLEYQRLFVQCLNWFEDADYLYISMEYIRHGDLQRHIDQYACFTEEDVISITKQVASALKYMHASGFAHRDLRPSNILVTTKGPSWNVKVADFGIATNVDVSRSPPSKDYIRTSGYMAPEMVDSSQDYTTAVDIWALGAVVFCLLVGVPPFHKLDDMLEYCAGIRQFPTRVLGLSSGFCIDFILRAMNPSLEERLSIQEVLHHEWLVVRDMGIVPDHRFLDTKSLPKLDSLWRLSASSILHKQTAQASMPLYSPLVARNGGFPAMARHTCMVCLEGFEKRNDLFHHLEKEAHAVDPHTSRVGDYSRPKKCLPEAKKQKRQQRSEARQTAETLEMRRVQKSQGLMMDELANAIQKCNIEPEKAFMKEVLQENRESLGAAFERTEKERFRRVVYGRNDCRCKLCGRGCHSMYKFVRHLRLEHGASVEDDIWKTVMPPVSLGNLSLHNIK